MQWLTITCISFMLTGVYGILSCYKYCHYCFKGHLEHSIEGAPLEATLFVLRPPIKSKFLPFSESSQSDFEQPSFKALGLNGAKSVCRVGCMCGDVQ
uniref:Putative secreted protein n=1 Tax=Ixodes ricinus TaxID=34613 RepID=A0A6B0UAB6_IXORI